MREAGASFSLACAARELSVFSVSVGNAWGCLQQEASGLTLPFLLSKRPLAPSTGIGGRAEGLILDPGLRERERESMRLFEFAPL